MGVMAILWWQGFPKVNGVCHHCWTEVVIDPEIRFDKPCIKGTRITVGDILQWLSADMTELFRKIGQGHYGGIIVRGCIITARQLY